MGQRDRRFVAVDIGASFVRTAVLIESGDGWRIEDRRSRPWPARLSLDDQVSWLTRVAGDQAALAGAPANADGVGVSFAGAVDRDGLVARWPNRPEWVGIRLKAMLESGWGGAVAIDDDARCAARGELRCGAAAGFRHALVVTVGTGIGAGIILGGQLFRGPTGLAGDLGHIGMAGEPDGDGLCPCGRRGCVQMAASGRTIDALGAAGGVQDGRGLVAAANSGAGWALSALERCGSRLGDAAGNAAALLDLDAVVIGGGLGSRLGEPWYSALVDAVGRRTLGRTPSVVVRRAALGDDAELFGAAALAAEFQAADSSDTTQ